ncbi:7TM diverse intracellular signaling domain-containing protein [Halopseudomonas pachastrellae]|nr:7TM diverse intracellular signaling domain-containing protein [Halopseudomonas pachastrellae]
MLLQGLFYGVLLGLLAYNLFLLSSLREKAYFWYLLYLLNMVLFMTAFDGLAWKWINASVPVQTLTIYTLMFLHCAVSTQFSRYFLHTREQFPQLDLLLRSKILLLLLAMLSLPLISVDLYNNMASLFVLVSSIVLLLSGLYVWRRGFRYGSYYTLAWSLLLISLMLSTAGSLGYELPGIPYGSQWVKIGTCAEMILLSLGLADRINALKEARFHADESARQARLETRAQGRFLARMSHEIRTPMNGVLGMLQLLGDTRLDNRQRFYLDTSVNRPDAADGHQRHPRLCPLESGKVELEQLPFDPKNSRPM